MPLTFAASFALAALAAMPSREPGPKPVAVCIFYVTSANADALGVAGPGYYWDTEEDNGSYDSVSPMGPHDNEEEAQADAARTFASLAVQDGVAPLHYADVPGYEYGAL